MHKLEPQYTRSTSPTLVRQLDGRIIVWNVAAEKNYKIKKEDALNQISHQVLKTVFPQSLEEINAQLLRDGTWSGELLHTLPNGEKVKVFSSWQLDTSCNPARVIETNINFLNVVPEVSFLSKPRKRRERIADFLTSTIWWWLLPFVAVLIAVELLVEFSSAP